MVVENLAITDEFEDDPPEEEEEEEEEEEDLEDPMDTIREDCQNSHHCAEFKSRFMECEDRVNGGTGEPEEHCTEELLDFLHCADHCASEIIAELENTAALLSYGEMFQSREEQDLYEAQEELSQLQYEAKNTKREKVSVTAADLQKYVEERQNSDPLVVGIPNSQNPYREHKGCCIL